MIRAILPIEEGSLSKVAKGQTRKCCHVTAESALPPMNRHRQLGQSVPKSDRKRHSLESRKARLAHDRRFVGAVLLFVVFLFVLVVFIRISGLHRVAHDHEATPIDQPSGKVLGDVWVMLFLLLGDFTPGVHRPAGYVAAQLPNSGWPGPRSSGGCGLARPVVPGGSPC
jgi:hypothetical protein